MAATLVAGAGVLDLQSRATLTRLRLEQSNGRQARQLKQLRAGSHQMPSAPASAETLAFVSLADGATAADLEAEGMQVMTVIGNIVIVNIPLADAERMAACDAVRTMSLSRDVKPCMDLARKSAGVDVAQAGGDGLPKAYTGAGVFTAIVDQGVDPHHINFLDADGNNRIEYLSHITMNFMGTGLTKLDLANNRCLQTLDISGNRLSNVTLKGVFGDYEKNVLSEINASGNRLFSFTVTATTQLRKLDLSDNMLTSFTLKNYDSLVELDLSGNRLKDELNLAYLANAERIDLSNNAITTLVLDKMPALKSFDVTGNNLTLATVPYIEGIADGVYTYAPQKKYELAAFAPGVNLTSQNRIIDGKGTVFTWKKADGTVLVEGSDYSCADGATKFLKEDLGKVYCEMTNPAFPQFIGENAYMTTEVTVTGAPSILVASFTTLEDSDKGEVVFTGNKTSDLYIDWRGDGTEYIQYPINGSNYSSYAGQTTYKGAEVKVYTYESPDDVVQFSVYDVKMGKMDASPMKNLKGFSVGGAGLDESTLVFPSSPGLEEISLPGNSFSTKAFREFASLHHLVLTGNRYQSFDASGMTGLETLMLSDNELKSFKMDGNTSLWGLDLSGNGMESVDLSGAPVLSQIMLTGNKLSAIDLSPVKDVLVAIDLQRNAFNFATLPNRAEFPNLGVYLFVNQAPVAVECHDGMVDLSAQASVNGTPTEFRCFIGDVTIDPDTGELVGEELDSATANPDDPEFTVDNGVLSFRYVQDKPVVCVMTNGEYPNLLLYTLPFAIDKAGVDSVIADGDADAPVDVYTVAGVKVRSHVATADATRGLAPGFYIVGTRKVLVK